MKISTIITIAGSLFGSSPLLAATHTWPRCDSPIFCPGPILKTVELARLYPDSKTFVDKPTTKPLQQVLDSFKALGAQPSNSALQAWVDENFAPEGQELVQTTLPDFKKHVSFVKHIKDPLLRGFAQAVHGYWSTLSRTVNQTGLCKGCVSSFLPPVKSPFLVPGGRFREIYYWDTYFILEGALLSELYDTAKNMILNFLAFVDQFGFMPNGSRMYYLNRSQPPFLTQMVKIYYEKTQDKRLLNRALPTLDKELNFWYSNTSVTVDYLGRSYSLNRYFVQNEEPRPESYFEDYNTANNGTDFTDEEKRALYADLATGAETGWDYSSRWLRDPLSTNLRSLNTRSVVPVELNSLLYANELAMAKFYRIIKGSRARQVHAYTKRAGDRRKAMEAVLWDDKANSFYDFNLTTGHRSTEFALSNYFPFWLGPIPESASHDHSKIEAAFGEIKKLFNADPGILPTTLLKTGQQWDFPNGWPPLQFVAMKALLSADEMIGKAGGSSGFLAATAKDLAHRFSSSSFCAWVETGGSIPQILPKQFNTTDSGHMFEKYDVEDIGLPGGGGEYTVQKGFGWTNGVLLWTLNQFGDLSAPKNCTISGSSPIFRERLGLPPLRR